MSGLPFHGIRRAGMPAVAAAVVLLAGGCGGAASGDSGSAGEHSDSMNMSTGSPSAAGVVLEVTGTEYEFAPMPLKASAGLTTIRFTNKGAMEHDFSIKTLGVHLNVQPGKTAETTVTLKPGIYKSTCTIPGHAQSGMQATLTVS